MTAGRADGLVAVVLAAGEGRRLRPLSEILPKALCPVGNVPLVDRALAAVAPYADEVAVNVHHHRAEMCAHLDGRAYVSVEEPAPLGTAGALGRLREWIGGRDVLVHNADAYLPDGVEALVAGWDRERCRLLVHRRPGHGDFGDRRYLGACLLPWGVVRQLEPVPSGLYEVAWRDAPAGSLDLVDSASVAIDCGTPSDYLRANLHSSEGASVVGQDAVVEGELLRSVVWSGARVAADERLVECIRARDNVTVVATLR